MCDQYLVTGATGFLGRTVVNELIGRGATVRALVLPTDSFAHLLPGEVEIVPGDVRDKSSLDAFFSDANSHTCVIHCAGIVSIASYPDSRMYSVNVVGTWNIIQQCMAHDVGMLIYVSSVHAIPEEPEGTVMTENCHFSPNFVSGNYAKSKALATQMVLNNIRKGLRACVVFPSGLIGPGDVQNSSITSMVEFYLMGKLPFAVRGGYDFVDVRDVTQGILSCSEKGEMGTGYILSGHYVTIQSMLRMVGVISQRRYRTIYLPLYLARIVAPYYEDYCLKKKRPLYFTPYSVSVLESNGKFSHRAASKKFSYYPRPLKETVRDMTTWLLRQNAERKPEKILLRKVR